MLGHTHKVRASMYDRVFSPTNWVDECLKGNYVSLEDTPSSIFLIEEI